MAQTKTPTYLCIALFVLLLQPTFGEDAKCYYPNGKEAAGSEKPCSSAEGSACCPQGWECLDNGLCHLVHDNLFGRYSCTDQSWKAPGCPSNLCTYDMINAVGGEAITQCSDHDNQWCCNADATNVNCCKESPVPRPFFALQDGKAYATVGATMAPQAPDLASITGIATSGGSQPSSTPAPSSSNSPSSSDSSSSGEESSSPSATPTGPTTPITSLQTAISSGSTGIATVVITQVVSPAASSTSSPSPTNPSEKKSNIPVIVGCAVGIPLGLALVGILFWLFRKQAQDKKRPYSETPDPYTNGDMAPEFAGGAAFGKGNDEKYTQKHDSIAATDSGVAELGGEAIGPGRPFSTINGKAELESGAGFQAGTVPYSAGLVGVGGGNSTQHTPQQSWGSAPPGYSPVVNTNGLAGAAAVAGTPTRTEDGRLLSEAPDTSVHHPIIPPAGTTLAGQQQQTEGGQYIPYRPPPGHAAHMQNVAEMAELSATITPPAAELEVRTPLAELGNVRTPPA